MSAHPTPQASRPSRVATVRLLRPPLWRTVVLLVICALVGLVFLLGALGLSLQDPAVYAAPATFVFVLLDLVCGVAALGLLIPVHRRGSYPAALACCALTGFFGFAFPAVCVAISAVVQARDLDTRDTSPGLGLRVRRVLGAAGVMLAGALLAETLLAHWLPQLAGGLAGSAGAALLIFVVAGLVGLIIRSRRALLVALAAEADAARREEEALRREHAASSRAAQARLEQARAGERTQIAREMHDALSHELGVIAVHAGALEYRNDLTREQNAQAVETIAVSARRAGDELRRVLTVLRDGESCTAPPADLGDLQDLIGRLGGCVELELAPPLTAAGLGELSPSLSRNVFRIVQECLVNATRHAPGAPVQLCLAGSPEDGFSVLCRNPLPGPGEHDPSGTSQTARGRGQALGNQLGLLGLHERVRLSGGRSQSGSEPDQDPDGTQSFVVRVWLPWVT